MGNQQIVAWIDADSVLRVVKSRFNAEGHAFFEHRIIAERDIRRLVPLEVLAAAMSRSVVDVILHAVFDLVLVDLIGHIRAANTGPGFLDLDLNTLGHHLPHLFLHGSPGCNQVVTIALAAISAQLDICVDIERLALSDLIIEELIR